MKLKLFIVFTILFSIANAHSYSNNEGILSPNHSQEMKALRTKYFSSAQAIEEGITKITKLREEIKGTLYSFQYNRYIKDFQKSHKKAHKSAIKRLEDERKILLLFDIIIENLNTISQESENKELIEDTLLLISMIDTIEKEHLYSGILEKVAALRGGFHIIKKITKGPQASNLYNDGKFLSQEEINSLLKNNEDISLIDPPSSAFWTNNKVEDFNAKKIETYKGMPIFPTKGQTLKYKRMGSGQIKLKASFKDETGTKRDVTVRMGIEIHSGALASYLARSVGYHAIPSLNLKNLKMELGKTSFQQFVADWNRAHGADVGSIRSFLSYDAKTHTVTIKHGTVEAYPDADLYRKIGAFRSGRNGIQNRREYRAFLLISALVSLNDSADRQQRVDFYREDKNSLWKPKFFTADFGYSMGSWLVFDNMGTINDYTESIVTDKKNTVRINWASSGLNQDSYRAITFEDAKWLTRRLLKLSPEQINMFAKKAGFPAPVARLYQRKIRGRILNFAKAFNLVEKEKTLEELGVRSNLSIHEEFPKEVTKKGNLKYSILERRETNANLMGTWATKYEFLPMHGANLINGLLGDVAAIDIAKSGLWSSGTIDVEGGFKISGNRNIQINSTRSKEQQRFLVEDIFEISIPIGLFSAGEAGKLFELEIPLNLYYNFKFSHFHSAPTIKQAALKGFFKRFNPFELLSLKRNLKAGEVFKVSHSTGISAGTFRTELADKIEFNFSPLKGSVKLLKELYVANNEGVIEIYKQKTAQASIGSSIYADTYVKMGFNLNSTTSRAEKTLYKIDFNNLLDIEEDFARNAYRKALVHGKFQDLDEISKDFELREIRKTKSSVMSLVFWSKRHEKSNAYINFKNYIRNDELNEKEIENEYERLKTYEETNIFEYGRQTSTNKKFKGFWGKELDIGPVANIADIYLDFKGEGLSQNSILQFKVNKDLTEIEDMYFGVQVDRVDNFATRKEIQKDFFDFYNKNSGEEYRGKENSQYIALSIPEEITYISPLKASMSYELRGKGIKELLERYKNDCISFNNKAARSLNRIMKNNTCTKNYRDLEKGIDKTASLKKQRKQLKIKMKAISRILKKLVGSAKTQKVGRIRKYVSDKNLYLATAFDNILQAFMPVMVNKSQDYAPMIIGKYPGPSFTTEIERDNNLSPTMVNGR